MIYKIYSPGNCTLDFPTGWQWSKFITVHAVEVSGYPGVVLRANSSLCVQEVREYSVLIKAAERLSQG